MPITRTTTKNRVGRRLWSARTRFGRDHLTNNATKLRIPFYGSYTEAETDVKMLLQTHKQFEGMVNKIGK